MTARSGVREPRLLTEPLQLCNRVTLKPLWPFNNDATEDSLDPQSGVSTQLIAESIQFGNARAAYERRELHLATGKANAVSELGYFQDHIDELSPSCNVVSLERKFNDGANILAYSIEIQFGRKCLEVAGLPQSVCSLRTG